MNTTIEELETTLSTLVAELQKISDELHAKREEVGAVEAQLKAARNEEAVRAALYPAGTKVFTYLGEEYTLKSPVAIPKAGGGMEVGYWTDGFSYDERAFRYLYGFFGKELVPGPKVPENLIGTHFLLEKDRRLLPDVLTMRKVCRKIQVPFGGSNLSDKIDKDLNKLTEADFYSVAFLDDMCELPHLQVFIAPKWVMNQFVKTGKRLCTFYRINEPDPELLKVDLQRIKDKIQEAIDLLKEEGFHAEIALVDGNMTKETTLQMPMLRIFPRMVTAPVEEATAA